MTTTVPGGAWSPARLRVPPRVTSILVVLGFFASWEWAARSELFGPTSLARASRVAVALPEVMTTPTFLNDLTVTVVQILVSFLLALVVGVTTGWAMWRFRVVEEGLEPYLAALAGFPVVIFFPVFVGIFGLSSLPLILVAAILAMVPLALTTTTALKEVPQVLLRLSASLRMSTWRRYRTVLLPSALPHFVPGLRLGVLFSILGVVSSQFLLGTEGLGFRIALLYERFEMIEMYANVVIVVAVACFTHIALRLLENSVREDLA